MNQYKYHKEYRLKGFDYSKPGLYFITICTKNRICDLGKIEDSIMKLSEIGEIAEKFWIEISNRFKNVELDEFILMPNHLHGILKLTNHGRSAPRRAPTGIQPLVKNSISSIINHYKGNVKRHCNKNGLEYFNWQSRFHDRIIRNEDEYYRIKQYIKDNPKNWELDRNNK